MSILTGSATKANGVRAAPITAASILCLLIGVGTLIMGFVLFGLAAGFVGWSPPDGSRDFLALILNILIRLGATLSAVAGLLLVGAAVLHLLGWYWLWGGRIRGGVMGVIAGTVDVTTVIIGILLSVGLHLLGVPYLMPVMIALLLVGVALLVLIALGWKTLRYRTAS